ncbi:MAG: Xaa-Pro aminopeptidase [Evtepia sp.]|nr:Xaa-Pro aminopeptidase [Evtepia sp.]
MSTHLQALRKEMKFHQVHAFLITSTDFHGSEYTGAYFACREYISGFTGSAGTLLVFEDWAGLWTDGRYFLQAERELQGSGITLMRQGNPGVPSLEAVLSERLSANQCLAFDGRCVSIKTGKKLNKKLSAAGITIKTDLDLVAAIWNTRPPLSAQPAWLLETNYAGETREQKLARVRDAMKKYGADNFLLTSLEDIGWLLNLRGSDIACTPVVLSYLALSDTQAILFANQNVFSLAIQKALADAGVTLRPYDEFYIYAKSISSGSKVLIDGRNANFFLLDCLPPDARIIDRVSPIQSFKAVKNSVEVQNMKAAHLKDGIALTKFMYWLKKTVGRFPISEQSAAERLEEFRREQKHYLSPSFAPIVAFGPHGAIVHYSATAETSLPLQAEGFVLVDTGGHYLEGTTDCTRTFALGPLSKEQRMHYTAVLRGNLNLADAQFLHGCTGVNLDYLARSPLWSMKLDYNHGTGHGVGYLLNVHEGPNHFRWRNTAETAVLEAGMITSDEPGLYLEGQYGIRLENLLLCVPRGETQYGKFLGFEHLTLVPFDLDAVDSSQMNRQEIELLNTYHKMVFSTLSPHLTAEEATWLANATRPID